MEKPKIYISGAISNNKHYKRQFKRAERKLKKRGYKVFNPCIVPNIFSYDEFMKIDLAALECCDFVYMLDGWKTSNGAKIEHDRAKELNKYILYEEFLK
ncbi:MAG: DUF4406 domain-containing protein [Clostridia bacterium]|nr:DUF4406 domain-containing protein [Clostridia bacterium]